MSEAVEIIDTGTGELPCKIRKRVAVVTLNRPEARNSLSNQPTPALRSWREVATSTDFTKQTA